MKKRLIPEAFHPGEYILEEMKERGWTMSDLADKLIWSQNFINDVINRKLTISPSMANALGDVFGTGAQVWLNLQATYWLAKFEERRHKKGIRR